MAAVSREHEDPIAQFQKSLGDAVVLLLELKANPELPRGAKQAIDDAVEDLQRIIRELPQIAESRDSFKLVFGAIEKVVELWRRLFG